MNAFLPVLVKGMIAVVGMVVSWRVVRAAAVTRKSGDGDMAVRQIWIRRLALALPLTILAMLPAAMFGMPPFIVLGLVVAALLEAIAFVLLRVLGR